MKRVLLVEDHELLQGAIRHLLSSECQVVAILQSAEDLEHYLYMHRPDVLILDVSLPSISGLQRLPALRNEFPSLGIVITTIHIDRAYREAAARRGADAFVSKMELTKELLPAVSKAHARSTERLIAM